MSEESIPNLRRSIEAMKAKRKKLQDMYTEEGEHLRYYEEKETQIQEFIRELNNKNKELQKQIDARHAEQMTKNSLYDKQHQETIEKLYTQHQRLLEKKSDLLAKEKQGPLELQQLEEKYASSLQEKEKLLIKQRKLLQQEEKHYMEANERQNLLIRQIMNIQNMDDDFDDSCEDEEEEESNTNSSSDSDNDPDMDDFDFPHGPYIYFPGPKKNPHLLPGGLDFDNDAVINGFISDLRPPHGKSKDFGFPGLSTADFQFKTFMDMDDDDDDSFVDDYNDNFIATTVDFPSQNQASKGTQSSLIKSQIPTSFIQMPNSIFGNNNSYTNNKEETDHMEGKEAEKLIECFKQQLALKERTTTLTGQINALEQLKIKFESEIEQLKKEQSQQNNKQQQTPAN